MKVITEFAAAAILLRRTKKTIRLIPMLSMVCSLLILAALCHADVFRQSHPHLDAKRLKQAYTPHAQGRKITISDLVWSPDERHAFYIIREGPLPSTGESWETLFSVRRNGSHIRKLYTWQHPGSNHPDEDSIKWSPDSHRIIMLILNLYPAVSVNADGVRLVDIDPETSERRDLSRDINGKRGTGSILWKPGYYAFSPNGKYLLMTLGSGRQNLTNKRLVRIEYATGMRKVLTSSKMASFAGRWSPDGTHIAYIALPDSGGVNADKGLSYEEQMKHQHLYIMTADGRNKRRLTQDSGFFEEEPSWSSDGRTIFFVRRKLTAKEPWPRSLWKVRPDGTGMTQVRTLPPKEG